MLKKQWLCLVAGLCLTLAGHAAETADPAAPGAGPDLVLPKPELTGGRPLMECLARRQSSREFSERELSAQQLSNLLWAAWGINRPDGKRTAPTAHNAQDPLLYVALKSGLYRYEPKAHALQRVLATDLRAACGKQKFHQTAPVDLIYVSDLRKLRMETETALAFAWNHAGYISQNVYLYCASEGLATVVCAWFDAPGLTKAMNLPDGQKVLLTQPVGHPK